MARRTLVGCILLIANTIIAAIQPLVPVGVAEVDITPDYPIRLSGYGGRRLEAQGAVSHLWAKALAIGSDKDGPAVLLTVDNTGVPASIRDQVLQRLQKRAKVDSAHLALCSSHTHTAPCLAGNLPTLFGEPIPPEHEAHIERYTRELTDALEKVALAALKDRKPARLSWGKGEASFAANRRTKGGPVDHDLPILVVTDPQEHLRAVLVNYACHCTTLGPETNSLCGDWAGYAQEYLERDHPGAVVLAAIGCGADANPEPRTGLAFAQQHGRSVQTSVNEILGRTPSPIRGKLECRAKQIQLPFDKPRTREQWEQIAKQTNAFGYYARCNLAKLDRGESLLASLPYLVQNWTFGNDLAMVFLPGEVVVDYSLRLKKEFDRSRLWVNAYANDVPCYIPSERILKEGGYEGGGAMMYYDKPNRLAPGVEALIVNAVHDLLPKSFVADETHAEFPPPKSPEEALASMQTKAGLEVQLVAAEPLVVDPVAIDWGPDGKLWVVEMRDYPTGMDGHWKPGSRVKYLEDTNGDGKYDKATVLLDDLPFATGVTAWRRGVLVCTAPDILYAEVPKQGKPVVRKIFTGFATDNYQARVNSLSLGLDNWIYGANGLLGGVIRGKAEPLFPRSTSSLGSAAAQEVDVRGRDFRFDPRTGAFEPASGLTQQGRVRDDWGNWFGCDNSTLAWHYPLPDHYIRRNPYAAPPSARVAIGGGEDPNLLHPISHMLERFNQPQSAGRVTSACGITIYRDDLLGKEFYGNAFVCDPVHNLVHRLVLHPEGATFSALRAEDEQHSEFLASRDNWFRPVQARTGPDGALWIVDMYRFVIEHPRWISQERLAKLDVRAGDDKGRIYRIVPKGAKLRAIPDLTKLSSAKLAAALDSPNGTERDRLHTEILSTSRSDEALTKALERLASTSKLPAARLQALCVLDGLGRLRPEFVHAALADPSPGVRANAIRLAEKFPAQLLDVAKDSEPCVRFQLALSLGQSSDPRAGDLLGQLAATDLSDSWMRAALVSSSIHYPQAILRPVLASSPKAAGRAKLVNDLIATAVGAGTPQSLAEIAASLVPADKSQRPMAWQLTALNSLFDALDRKHIALGSLPVAKAGSKTASEPFGQLFEQARSLASSADTPDDLRIAAIRLLNHDLQNQASDLQTLAQLLNGSLSTGAQTAVLDTLKRIRNSEVATLLLDNWTLRPPSLRQAAVDILFTRDDWLRSLLDAVEKNQVSPNEISPAQRQQLLKNTSPEIQQRAQALLKSNQASRAEVLAQYKSATTLSGDVSKGAAVFAKSCATCHLLRGQGYAVGPNLAPLADKSPADFLTAILDPNAAVEPRFIAYNVETKDGRSLTGVVNSETATALTLIQGGGAQENILRSDVASMRASGLSLMPEGLEQNLTPRDLADVIAWLKTTPRPFGSASAEQAGEALKKFVSGGCNGIGKLESAFDQLPYPSWMGSLPMPYCRQTDGQSRLVWQTVPVPSGLKADSSYTFRLPAGMGFVSQPGGKFVLRLNGQPVLEFNVALTDQSWQSADGKVRMSYTVMEDGTEDSDGVLLIEVAASLLTPGQPAKFEVVGSASNSQRWFGIYLLPGSTAQAAGRP